MRVAATPYGRYYHVMADCGIFFWIRTPWQSNSIKVCNNIGNIKLPVYFSYVYGTVQYLKKETPYFVESHWNRLTFFVDAQVVVFI